MLLFLVIACTEYGVEPVPQTSPVAADTGSCGGEAVSLEVATDPACSVRVEPPGGFDPVIEWTKRRWSVAPESAEVLMTPAVGALTDDDGDGDADAEDVPSIVVTTVPAGGSTNGTLRAVRGDGGDEVWSVTGLQFNGVQGVAIADLDADGWSEVIAPVDNASFVAVNADGSVRWTSEPLWAYVNVTASPSVADLDGDGSPEVVVGSAVLDADGALVGAGAYGTGAGAYGSGSFAVDLDGDGDQEVVTGNAVYARDGTARWYNGLDDGVPAVADVDGDGDPEIIVVGDGFLRVQYADGVSRCSITLPDANLGGAPTLADLDGDEAPEIVVASFAAITAYDTACSPVWSAPVDDDSSGSAGSAAFDFEGDGSPEIVYADETSLWVFAGADGSVRYRSREHTSMTAIEYPVIADVDRDGSAEIVVPDSRLVAGDIAGLTVFGDAGGSWRPARPTWSQYAWHQTNVEDGGRVPPEPESPWATLNSFRSAIVPEETAPAPDLVPYVDTVCAEMCDADSLAVWVGVGNAGGAEAPAGVTVDLYGTADDGTEQWLGSQTLEEALPPGRRSSSWAFAVAAEACAGGIRVVVDEPGAVEECDEENVALGAAPVCEE